jgi:hypothetical protein
MAVIPGWGNLGGEAEGSRWSENRQISFYSHKNNETVENNRPRGQPELSGARSKSGFEVGSTKVHGSVEVSDARKKTRLVGSTGSRISCSGPGIRKSCGLRGLLFNHTFRLRAFLSLDNFEFDVIALLEALISLRLDGTVVDEHIGPIISADKAEALCVIEPFHFSFNSRHVPYSGRPPGYTVDCGPSGPILFLVLPLLLGGTFGHRRFQPSPDVARLIPVTLAIGSILRFISAGCQLI